MRLRRSIVRPSRGGFTLIEVLAALVIFGVAIVGFMQAMGESARIQGNLAMMQRAGMLAQNVLEEMRYGDAFEAGSDEGDFKGEDAMFRWASEVEEDPKTDGLLDVTVTVSWNDGRERECKIMTQVAQKKEQ